MEVVILVPKYPNKTVNCKFKNVNLNISNLTTRKMNEKHISCECKCKFDGKKCNSNQNRNNGKWQCDCKKKCVPKRLRLESC